jgi:hypothetical protein
LLSPEFPHVDHKRVFGIPQKLGECQYIFSDASLVLDLFHAGHHRHVHAAVLGAPIVKLSSAQTISRQMSGTAKPASSRLTASIIWLSANFNFLM